MKQQAKTKKSIAKATFWLVLFQIVGLLIPIFTLPILARGLGVSVFGQVMLAQAIVFFGVLFVDAGFNTESQRRASIAIDPLETQQALIDNFIARALCSVPVVAVLLLVGYFVPDLPFRLVAISLPLVLGTLLFPQWWYVARQEGIKMGVVGTLGRLISALAIVFWVDSPMDATVAAFAASSATLFSGLMLIPQWWRNFHPYRALINWQGWRQYLKDIRHTIFSGFFSSASSSIPVLVLGFIAGTFQTGLFTAADRLTRAAAYVLSFIEQSFMGWLAKINQHDRKRGAQIRKRVLIVLATSLLLGCGAVAFLSSWTLHLLYGNSFVGSIPILKALSLWLLLYGLRKACLTFFWSATGDLKMVALFQWAEAVLVSLFTMGGAVWLGGLGVAFGLCSAEVLLLCIMLAHRRSVT